MPKLRWVVGGAASDKLEDALNSASEDWGKLENALGEVAESLLAVDERSVLLPGQILAVDSQLREGRELGSSVDAP